MTDGHTQRSRDAVAVLPMGAWLCMAANPAMLALLAAKLAAGLGGGAAAAAGGGLGAAGLGWAADAAGVAAVAAAATLAVAAAGRFSRLTCTTRTSCTYLSAVCSYADCVMHEHDAQASAVQHPWLEHLLLFAMKMYVDYLCNKGGGGGDVYSARQRQKWTPLLFQTA